MQSSVFLRTRLLVLMTAALCGVNALPAKGCPTQSVVDAIRPNRDGTLTVWTDDGQIADAKASPPAIAPGFVAHVVECRRSATQHLIYRIQLSPTQFMWLSPANLKITLAQQQRCTDTTKPFGARFAPSGMSCIEGK